MAVYVDDLQDRKTVRRITASWSRLLADDEVELVVFGRLLGQLPAWLIGQGRPDAHFLLVNTARQRALRAGAVGITAAEADAMIAARRAAAAAVAPPPAPVVVVTLDPADVEEPVKPLPRWNPETRRHAWLKVREHFARCRHCDLEAENEQQPDGKWFRWWRWPDGLVTADLTTPKCPGPAEGGPVAVGGDDLPATPLYPA